MKPIVSTLLLGGLLGIQLCGCNSADTSKAGDEVQSQAQQAGQAIQSGTQKAKVSADSDLESGKVMSALNSAANLEAKNIKVDTDLAAKTVTLSGTVPTSKQKDQAIEVAKGITGTDFKVVDSITVKAD